MTVAMPPLLGGLGRALVQQGRLQETEAERIAADAKPEAKSEAKPASPAAPAGGNAPAG
jgi:hypothetical protein